MVLHASAPKQPQTAFVAAGLKEVYRSFHCLHFHPLIVPMDSIRQRFLQAENDFLSAPHLDGDRLADFAERWQTLWSDWESCLHEADHDTRQLIDAVVAKIEGLAGDFYHFESQAQSLRDDLLNSLEDVFASLTLEETPISHPDPVSNIAAAATASSMERDTISPSQWLLSNLHNPYPLPHVRFSAGRTAGSKHTKDWFFKARQRIGWTRLQRDRFAGCRSVAIEAAFRAFVRDDPNRPLDNDLKTAFLAIKSHAELVYGDEGATLHPSPKRPRSISPTPSLTFSSGSEDSDDERSLVPSSENASERPLKRASLDPPGSPLRKRRRSVDCCVKSFRR